MMNVIFYLTLDKNKVFVSVRVFIIILEEFYIQYNFE